MGEEGGEEGDGVKEAVRMSLSHHQHRETAPWGPQCKDVERQRQRPRLRETSSAGNMDGSWLVLVS